MLVTALVAVAIPLYFVVKKPLPLIKWWFSSFAFISIIFHYSLNYKIPNCRFREVYIQVHMHLQLYVFPTTGTLQWSFMCLINCHHHHWCRHIVTVWSMCVWSTVPTCICTDSTVSLYSQLLGPTRICSCSTVHLCEVQCSWWIVSCWMVDEFMKNEKDKKCWGELSSCLRYMACAWRAYTASTRSSPCHFARSCTKPAKSPGLSPVLLGPLHRLSTGFRVMVWGVHLILLVAKDVALLLVCF